METGYSSIALFSHNHKWTYRWLSWHVHYSSSSSLGLRSIMDIDACTDRSSFEGLFAAKEAQVQRHNGGSTTITINLSSQSSASSPSSLHWRPSQHLDFRKPVHIPLLTECKGSSPCFKQCEFWSSFCRSNFTMVYLPKLLQNPQMYTVAGSKACVWKLG